MIPKSVLYVILQMLLVFGAQALSGTFGTFLAHVLLDHVDVCSANA